MPVKSKRRNKPSNVADSKLEKRKGSKGEGARTLDAAALVPFELMYEGGVSESVPGRFSRSLKLGDTNYADERTDVRDEIFDAFSAVHAYFPPKSTYQLNLITLPSTARELMRPLPEAGADATLARSANDLYAARMREGILGLTQSIYLTFSVAADSLDSANVTLATLRDAVSRRLARIDVSASECNGMARMELLNDLIRGTAASMLFDYGKLAQSKNLKCRDFLTPEWAHFPQKDALLRRSIAMPGRHVKVFWLRDFASNLSDRALGRLHALPIPKVISLTFCPQVLREAIADIKGNIANIQGDIFSYQSQVAKASGDITRLPPALESKADDAEELLEFIIDKDQGISYFQGLIALIAEDEAQMAHFERQLRDEAGTWGFVIEDLALRQPEAFASMLPLATPRLERQFRSLSTAEGAALIPFVSQSVIHDPKTSYYLGHDSVSNRPIWVTPAKMKSPHMWVLGLTGAGKGVDMKTLYLFSALSHPRTRFDTATGRYLPATTDAPQWFFMDFHGEYPQVIEATGGKTIPISPVHNNCINPLDISSLTGELDAKAVINATDGFLALATDVSGRALEQRELSMLDRCLSNIYKPHLGKATRPVLDDLYKELIKQKNPVATALAADWELFVTGSMSAFNGPTTVLDDDYATVYDFSELGETMRTFAYVSALMHIESVVYANWRCGRKTILVLEEAQILFSNDAVMEKFDRFYSELRKYGLQIIAVTQLPGRVLDHEKAQYFFDNASIFLFLAQQKNNQNRLTELFNLSRAYSDCISMSAEPGSGLVIAGGVKIAMRNPVDAGSAIYELVNTDPDKLLKASLTAGKADNAKKSNGAGAATTSQAASPQPKQANAPKKGTAKKKAASQAANAKSKAKAPVSGHKD